MSRYQDFWDAGAPEHPTSAQDLARTDRQEWEAAREEGERFPAAWVRAEEDARRDER